VHYKTEKTQVNGTDVYPAAGMLVMAIEAVRQLLPAESMVVGYRFKDVSFQSALTLGCTPQGTETQLVLRPSQETAANRLSKWNKFRICVFDNKAWRECCRGAIVAEYNESVWSPSGINERDEDHASHSFSSSEAHSNCCISLDKKKVYQTLRKIGLEYGPTFQALDGIRVDNHGTAVSVVNLQHWKSVDTNGNCKTHLIHPTALDAILQLAFPAFTGSSLECLPTMVPTCIRNLWISNDINKPNDRRQLNACAKSTTTGLREVHASLIAKSTSNDKVLVTADASMTIIDSVRPTQPTDRDLSRRFYTIEYHPDVALLDDAKQLDISRGLQSIQDTDVPNMDMEKEWLCLAAITAVIHDLSTSYIAPKPHLQRYVGWMKRQLALAKEGPDRFRHARECSESDPDHFYYSVRDFDAEGAIITKIAQNLSKILYGKIDPLELLFSDDLLERLYRDGQWTIKMKDQIKAFIRAIAHKSPGLRMLEVGAGTGGMTSVVLDALGVDPKHGSAIRLFDEYIYTDISPSFFIQAKKKFSDSRLQFRTLDISSNPSDQGFESGRFDIVMASNVLHATPNIEETLKNCRNLLKSGGKLILHENMDPDGIRGGFMFGLLPGWWLSHEQNRQWSPLMSQTGWNRLLVKTGFSGSDLLLEGMPSGPSYMPILGVLLSTAIPVVPLIQQTIKGAPNVIIVYEQSSMAQHQICEHIQRQHTTSGMYANLAFIRMDSAPTTDFTNSTCIFLPDLDRPLLQSLRSNDLSLIKHICFQANGIIWVCGKSKDSDTSPNHALAKGLGRTIESENLDFSFVTITLEVPYNTARAAVYIWKVLLKNPQRPEEGYENEYVERNDVLCIPRLVEAPEVTARVYPDPDTRQHVLRKWNDDTGKPIRLTVGTVGLLDTLVFEEFEKDSTALALHEVEVQVLAVGLNFKDVLTALGQVNDNYLGNELVGIVTDIRSSDTLNLNIGDTVVGVHTGTMATKLRCKAHQLHRLPAEIPLLTGAALPLVYCTAYYSLVSWARAQPGESILIHSGAGGVGQAAIQLSKILGLTIFTTTSSNDKVQLLMDMYGIPKNHIFSSRSIEFASGIKRLTDDVGVDIVLNSLSGEALRKSWEVLAPFGRFIELGKKDIHSTGNSSLGCLPMQPFEKNVMFASVDLPALYKTRDRISEVLSAVVKLVAEGKIKQPSPVQVFKGSEIQQAFRLMQTGKHMGKLVIEFSDEDLVEVKRLKRKQLFDAKSTYIIAGGLGGIARSICKWMVRKGARHIALLSRSRTCDSETESFLDDLRSSGTEIVAHPCDVSDASQLQTALNFIESTMPPIKGCIQAAMVLRVSRYTSVMRSMLTSG
jgi:NADPH:quinone reductase-like Zn-dependent oxidoreductase/ubiquinone/menaquinone biosynthesis C-methylase UbiE